jgi:hypothetical protein
VTADVWAEILLELGPGHPLYQACADRRALGIERYGVPLTRGVDLDLRAEYEAELLDGVAYAWAIGERLHAAVLMGLLSESIGNR